MRGEVNEEVINTAEAAMLVNFYQIFYLSENHYKLVVCFNERPSEFDVEALLNVFS